MSVTPEPLKLRNLRFNLLLKNLASGVGVLLTPGLLFLISLVVLVRLYLQLGRGETFEIAWAPIIVSLVIAVGLGALVAWKLTDFVADSITNPAASIGASSRAIAVGDFTQSSRAVTNDELLDLSQVMNNTREILRQLLQNTTSVYSQVGALETELQDATGQLQQLGQQVTEQVTLAQPKTSYLQEIAAKLLTSAEEISVAREELATQTANTLQIGRSEIIQVAQVTALIEELSLRSQQISQAVLKIADIAEQTNLLALNATIESAKAGDIGAGFAVVAGQIKELAVQTGESARAVTEAAVLIQEHCDTTVGLTAQVTTKLEQINASQEESTVAVEDQAIVTSSMLATCQEVLQDSSLIADSVTQIQKNFTTINQVLHGIDTDQQDIEIRLGQIRQRLDGLELGEVIA